MKRFAAHYIFAPPDKVYKLHFIELDGNDALTGIYPLTGEAAGIYFSNGILILSHAEINTGHMINSLTEENKKSSDLSVFQLLELQSLPSLQRGRKIYLYHLDGIDLLSAKFGTSNSGSHGNIKRLC